MVRSHTRLQEHIAQSFDSIQPTCVLDPDRHVVLNRQWNVPNRLGMDSIWCPSLLACPLPRI